MPKLEKKRNVSIELKRKILIEAGHRCAIPTCRNVVGADIHHIIPWSQRKEHNYQNLIALCPNCHRMADRGYIDRKSLRMYKNNLRFLYDKFSVFEIDLLFDLNRLEVGKKTQFFPFLKLFIKRIIDAGYISYEETFPRVAIGNVKIDPDLIKITQLGRVFIKNISSKNIGY